MPFIGNLELDLMDIYGFTFLSLFLELHDCTWARTVSEMTGQMQAMIEPSWLRVDKPAKGDCKTNLCDLAAFLGSSYLLQRSIRKQYSNDTAVHTLKFSSGRANVRLYSDITTH